MVGVEASDDGTRESRPARLPVAVVARTGLRLAGARRLRRRSVQLSGRTRSDLLDALDRCAGRPEGGGRRPVRTVQFLRPPAVPDHLGCVACAVADEETRRWFFFFETETNHDPDVRGRIRVARGLCAPHTRRLLGSTSAAAWLARGVFADLLGDAARGWPQGGRAAGGGPRRAGRRGPADCPVCRSVADRVRDILNVLSAALGDGSSPTVGAYRAGSGLCLPHARRFLTGAGSAAAVVVADHLHSALSVAPEQALAVLLGGDDDAPARARIRAEHADAVLAAAAAARRESFGARVAHLTAQPCCPVCAARDRAGWRLLDWLGGRGGGAGVAPGATSGVTGEPGGRSREEPDAPAMREQLTAVCPIHLADLARADGGGAWLSAPVATVARLAATRARESAVVVATAAGRGVAGPALHALAVSSGPRMSCPVCAWSAEAAAREVDLLRLVAGDPRWTGEITSAHGLCARCLPGLADGPAGPWSTTFATRARQLSFELAEAVRTDSWSSRWDVRGAEMSSWRRAPFLLDGAVLGPRPPG